MRKTWLAGLAVVAIAAVVPLTTNAGAATSAPTPKFTDTDTVDIHVVVKDTTGKVLSTTDSTTTAKSGGKKPSAATMAVTPQQVAPSGCAEVWASTTKRRTYVGQPVFTVYTYKIVKDWCWN